MRRLIPLLILMLFAAFLFGCTQQGQNPPLQQPPQLTNQPIEDIAAQTLEGDVPSSNENLTDLDYVLVSATS